MSSEPQSTCECGAPLPPVPDVTSGRVSYHTCECGRQWAVSDTPDDQPFVSRHFGEYHIASDEWSRVPPHYDDVHLAMAKHPRIPDDATIDPNDLTVCGMTLKRLMTWFYESTD